MNDNPDQILQDTMQDSVADLERQIAAIDRKLLDVKGRMPAHSVKPALMNELFSLEDEREQLREQLEKVYRQD